MQHHVVSMYQHGFLAYISLLIKICHIFDDTIFEQTYSTCNMSCDNSGNCRHIISYFTPL